MISRDRLLARGWGACFGRLLARGCDLCFERLLARGCDLCFERLLARGWLRDEELERLLARGWLREEERLEEELALADDFEPDDFEPDDFEPDDFERSPREDSALANAAGITNKALSRAVDHQPARRRCELLNFAAVFHMILLLLRYRPVSPTPVQAPDVMVS